MKSIFYELAEDKNGLFLREVYPVIPIKIINQGSILLHTIRIINKDNSKLFWRLIIIRVKLSKYKSIKRTIYSYYKKLGFEKNKVDLFKNKKYSKEIIHLSANNNDKWGFFQLVYVNNINKK